jgi:large subunit ribosomal protein L25
MSELSIEVQERGETGKNASRRLRAGGSIPAVVYGGKQDSLPIQVDRRTVHELLKKGGGENAVFLLKLAGTAKTRHAMIRHLDVDPVSRQITHIDFQRIDLSEKVRIQVSIHTQGEAVGVKNEGGVLDFVTRTVEVECLPSAIPQRLDVDVSELHVGQHLEARQLALPAGVELLEEADRVIVSVSHSRVAAEMEQLAEGAAGAETLIEAEKVEPEVIGRGKEEDEEAEEDEG